MLPDDWANEEWPEFRRIKASFYCLSKKKDDFQEFFSQQLLYVIK